MANEHLDQAAEGTPVLRRGCQRGRRLPARLAARRSGCDRCSAGVRRLALGSGCRASRRRRGRARPRHSGPPRGRPVGVLLAARRSAGRSGASSWVGPLIGSWRSDAYPRPGRANRYVDSRPRWPGHHVPLRLRPRRRLRRRLPRRDRARSRPTRASSTSPTASPRHDVRTGALVLRRALPYFPPGVHLAVVDPEVGGERRAVALRARRGGPHARRPRQRAALAGRASASAASSRRSTSAARRYRLEPASATFHGRDIFAPVAAHARRRRAAGRARASRSTPTSSSPLDMPRARATRTAGSSPTRSPSTASATSRSTSSTRSSPAPASSSATGSRSTASPRSTRRRSPTSRPASCCSTRTPTARSRWRSTAARRRELLGLELDAEVRIRPA